MFLVKDKLNNMKLVMIQLDPWKRIGRDQEFDQPEMILIFDGDVAKPPNSI